MAFCEPQVRQRDFDVGAEIPLIADLCSFFGSESGA